MTYSLRDTFTIDAGANVRFTEDGYMVAMPRVARTGIQLYSGDEVGKPDMKVVRVFRPEAEVFNSDSLHSYAHRPLTNDHPPEPVTSENWKKYATGDTGEDVVRDGEFVRVPLVMMDKQAVKDYKDGKRELSLGYTCDLAWTPGTAPNGEAYDAVQTNIRANHLAQVKAARGGSNLRVGDVDTKTCPECGATMPASSKYCPDCGHAMGSQQKDEAMTTATQTTAIVMCDGAPIQIDAVSAAVINAHIARLTKSAESLQGKLDEAEGKNKKAETDAATVATQHKTSLDAKDAEITTLKKQLGDAEMSPQKIDALVIDRSNVIAGAKKVLGDKLVIDNKTNADIRRQVVDAVMKDAAKGWSDDAVVASYNTIIAQVKDTGGNSGNSNTNVNHRPGGASGTTYDDVRNSFRFAAQDHTMSDSDKAYGTMVNDMANAWKGEQPKH
jgi:hypothetical protein